MEFQLTPRLRDAARELCGVAAGDAEDEFRALTRAGASTVSLASVQLMSQRLRAHAKVCSIRSPVWVHQLLEGASPVLPQFASDRKPHASLEPRLAELREAQENREYAAMVGGLASGDSGGRDAAEMSTYRSQLGVGVNLIVSMGTMFCVGFWAGGTEADPHGVRATVCGLVACIATMVVEMALFLIGATRVDAKMQQREKSHGKASKDLTRLRELYPSEVAATKKRATAS